MRQRAEGKDSRMSVAAERILIVKPSSLGDIVHSLPFLNAIKACRPKAEIHWVVARGLEGLLEGHPMIDKLIIIDKDGWKKLGRLPETFREVGGLFKELRRGRYDLVIDLQGLFRSGAISMATGAPVRVGFSEAREGGWLFYTQRVKGGREIHAVDRYLKIAASLGCAAPEVIFPFPLMKNDEGRVSKNGARGEEYVVLVPGARWDTKKWPAENFGRIASLLPLKSVVIGSNADREIGAEIVRASGGKAVSLAGETNLRELMQIMRRARLVISNDSGPMHIAAGFHVPVVAIFGPTSPGLTGPYGQGNVVVKSDAECAPCFKKRCSDLKCMRQITVDAVYDKVLDRLNVA